MIKKAVFSTCRRYRYGLWRIWDDDKPMAMFIGLNPSTADETNDDPTMRRCISLSQSWGYGGLCMANLFACRSTDPEQLKTVDDPVGPENDFWIRKLSHEAPIVVAAWGNLGSFESRGEAVLRRVPQISCLAVNKSGQPRHPLHIPVRTVPRAYRQ